ncbi:unnamed protein product [Protopolystoma xenopodis]|uniref:Uncharacterized protein n=1 Tax=Protopolystoma xenopodis TaxID=117903 RepID=A0A3S5FD44_9PLAT|nr:unnamed protein product [Protopolystoma xenopodis]
MKAVIHEIIARAEFQPLVISYHTQRQSSRENEDHCCEADIGCNEDTYDECDPTNMYYSINGENVYEAELGEHKSGIEPHSPATNQPSYLGSFHGSPLMPPAASTSQKNRSFLPPYLATEYPPHQSKHESILSHPEDSTPYLEINSIQSVNRPITYSTLDGSGPLGSDMSSSELRKARFSAEGEWKVSEVYRIQLPERVASPEYGDKKKKGGIFFRK